MVGSWPPPGHLSPEALLETLEALLAPLAPEIGRRGSEIQVTVEGFRIEEASRLLREDRRLCFDFLRCISAVDWPEQRFDVVYHLTSTVHLHQLTLKAKVARESPSLPSVTSVWKGADWHEREAAEMYGLIFEGHPHLVQLLLWDGAPATPQRRSVPVLPLEEFWVEMRLEELATVEEQVAPRRNLPARLQKRGGEGAEELRERGLMPARHRTPARGTAEPPPDQQKGDDGD